MGHATLTAATGLLGVCHHRHDRRSHHNWHHISTRVSHVFLYGAGKNRKFFRTRFLMKIRVENCEVVTLWPQAYKMTVRVKSFEVEIFYGRWHMKWHFLADQQAEGKRCLSLWIVYRNTHFAMLWRTCTQCTFVPEILFDVSSFLPDTLSHTPLLRSWRAGTLVLKTALCTTLWNNIKDRGNTSKLGSTSKTHNIYLLHEGISISNLFIVQI